MTSTKSSDGDVYQLADSGTAKGHLFADPSLFVELLLCIIGM